MPRMISSPCSPQLPGTECCVNSSLFITTSPFHSSSVVVIRQRRLVFPSVPHNTSCLYVACDRLSGAALSHADLLRHALSRRGQLFNKKYKTHIS